MRFFMSFPPSVSSSRGAPAAYLRNAPPVAVAKPSSANGASSIQSSAKPAETTKPESKPVLLRENKGCFRAFADFLVMLWQKITFCFYSKDKKAAVKEFHHALSLHSMTKDDAQDLTKLSSLLKSLPEQGPYSEEQKKAFKDQLKKMDASTQKDVNKAINDNGFDEGIAMVRAESATCFHLPAVTFLACCAEKMWDPKTRSAVLAQLDGSDERYLQKIFQATCPHHKTGFKAFVKTASDFILVAKKMLKAMFPAQ